MKKLLLILLASAVLTACSSPVPENDSYLKLSVSGVPALIELPDSKVIEEKIFDDCNSNSHYRKNSWYEGLKSEITKVKEDPLYSFLGGSKLGRLCLSSDEKIVIGLYSFDLARSGFVFRYDIDNNELEIAKFLDEKVVRDADSFYGFGEKKGDIIPVFAGTGNGGCVSKVEYDYNYVKNTLDKRRRCTGCNELNDAGEKVIQEEACTLYATKSTDELPETSLVGLVEELVEKKKEDSKYDENYTDTEERTADDGRKYTVSFLNELPASKVMEERPFDGCGEKEKYQGHSWFTALESGIEEVKKRGEYIPLEGANISELCLSLDKKIVIGFYAEQYCASGFVFRYDVDVNEVEVAKFLDDVRLGCTSTFSEFGKRNGPIIPVTSVFGDAGFTSKMEYDYDFTKNTLKERRVCQGHWIEEPGKEGVYTETCEDL